MTAARTSKARSSLAGKMSLPGGRTMDEAVRAADAGLESHREDGMRALAATLERLEAACTTRGEGAGVRIYELASEFTDIAGLFTTGPLYASAFSLCETCDRMLAGGVWQWASVEVHVQALRLILADGCRDSEASHAILEGLAAVVGKLAR